MKATIFAYDKLLHSGESGTPKFAQVIGGLAPSIYYIYWEDNDWFKYEKGQGNRVETNEVPKHYLALALLL